MTTVLRASLAALLVSGLVSGAVLVAEPAASREVTIAGEVELVDEQGARVDRRRLDAFIDIIFFYTNADLPRMRCVERGEVPSAPPWTFDVKIPDDSACFGKPLAIDVEISYGPDWKRLPPPTELQWISGNNRYNVGKITVLRPSNPAPDARAAIMRKAESLLVDGELDTALLAFEEAGRGDDIAYTARAANLLEDAGHQPLVYDLLAAKDLEALKIGSITRFRLAMRKANAARAAERTDEKYAAYESAQAILPSSRQPISIVFTDLREEYGDTNALAEGLAQNPEDAARFEAVYEAWSAENKPGGDIVDNVRFTADRILSIPGPSETR